MEKMGKTHNNKGFTLIEMLVTAATLSIVIASVALVFQSSRDTWTRGQDHVDSYQNARIIMDRISNDLRATMDLPDTTDDFMISEGGTSDRLYFYTATSQAANFGYARVFYVLNPANNVLYRLLKPDDAINSLESPRGSWYNVDAPNFFNSGAIDSFKLASDVTSFQIQSSIQTNPALIEGSLADGGVFPSYVAVPRAVRVTVEITSQVKGGNRTNSYSQVIMIPAGI